MIEREEVINAIYDLFIIRNDVFAVQQTNGNYYPEEKTISTGVITDHLDGKKTIGIYTVSKDKKCKWVCYDFDGDDLETEKKKAIELYIHLREKGFIPLIEFSGMKGYHVWLFFKEIDAFSAYQFGRDICKGFEVHEIFPKQYEIKDDGLGNLVKLPLAIHRVSRNRSCLLHPDTYAPLDFETSMDLIYTISKRTRDEIPKYIKMETVTLPASKSDEKEEMSEVTRYLIDNGVGEGQRHKKEWFITVDLYLSGWKDEEILEQVLLFNSNNKPPKDEHLVINHVNHILKNPKEYIEKYGFLKNETIANSLKWIMKKEYERIERNKLMGKEVIQFDQRLFNYSVAMAFVKNMKIITVEDTGEILSYNKDTGIYEENGEEMIESTCVKYLNKYKTTSMMKEVFANIKAKTFVKRKLINKNKMIFAVKNGIFNIDTMEISPFNPDIMLTTSIPITYNKDAICPIFKKFLSEVICNDDILNIQEFFGYCLYRDYNIHKAFMLYGSGSNGKSTLINVLKVFLSEDNTISIALQDFDSDKFSSARLYNKLANMYADLPDKALQSTGRFKMLTGNDMISGQRKFQESFNFTNYAKMIFSCNVIPKNTDDTDAFWRRWIIIMFNNRFEGKNRDEKLLEKLTTEDELSGIFNWAIEGLKRLLKQGDFSNYVSVEKMRELYIRKSDPVHTFVMDCVVEDEEAETLKTDLFNEYKKYAQKHGLKRITEQKFGVELKSIQDISFDAKRSSIDTNRRWVWIGVRLKTPSEMEVKTLEVV